LKLDIGSLWPRCVEWYCDIEKDRGKGREAGRSQLSQGAKIMQSTTHLWHPISEARLYKSAGSRTSFHQKWSPESQHVFDPTHMADADEETTDESTDVSTDVSTDEKTVERKQDLECSAYLKLQKALGDKPHGNC
jgi:hypothetical protein